VIKFERLTDSAIAQPIFQLRFYRGVVSGCETWSLTLKEEHMLRVVDNRVLRKTSGNKREGVTGYWRKLYNEKLRELYRPLNSTRIIE